MHHFRGKLLQGADTRLDPANVYIQYRTTEERWPPVGAVKTDASGTATITFNVGAPTPNYPVQVRVFVQADDQQLTWSTSFTPR